MWIDALWSGVAWLALRWFITPLQVRRWQHDVELGAHEREVIGGSRFGEDVS